MDSILDTIKQSCNIDVEETAFDVDIIMYANTAIFALAQSGVIPDTFVLTTKDQTWDELIPDRTDLTSVKSYISLKTRLIFDPPDKQGIVDAINRTISEIEYRLNLQVEVINP